MENVRRELRAAICLQFQKLLPVLISVLLIPQQLGQARKGNAEGMLSRAAHAGPAGCRAQQHDVVLPGTAVVQGTLVLLVTKARS